MSAELSQISFLALVQHIEPTCIYTAIAKKAIKSRDSSLSIKLSCFSRASAITEIMTLKFNVQFGAKVRLLGQFLTNKQIVRVLQVLGPMTQDIKHAVIDNRAYP